MSSLAVAALSKPLLEQSAALIVACRRHGLTLAAAESCTGGLLAAYLTEHAGVSDVFMGSAVTYSNAAKHEILGIDAEVINTFGAVSERVARNMATQACLRYQADCAVGITGIAGPSGGSDDKPVGTVDIAAALRGHTAYTRHHFHGDRHAIREQAVAAAFSMLMELIAAHCD